MGVAPVKPIVEESIAYLGYRLDVTTSDDGWRVLIYAAGADTAAFGAAGQIGASGRKVAVSKAKDIVDQRLEIDNDP